MPELAGFQRDFAELIAARAPIAELGTKTRLAVYRNTWRKALVDALADGYRVTRALVGDAFFEALSLDFIEESGCRTPVLAAFGQEFPAYIGLHRAADELPYLPDVACLERLITESHLSPDEPDPKPVAPALHPTIRLAWFETPAVTIWQAHEEPGGPSGLTPDWVSEGALIVRPGGAVIVERIGRDAYVLLKSVQEGTPLEQALRKADAAGPDFKAGLRDLLARNDCLSKAWPED